MTTVFPDCQDRIDAILRIESLESIADNFIFTSSRNIDENSVLYSEQIPGGFKAISMQTNGTTTEIDIELLFNAVSIGTHLEKEDTNE